MLPIQTRTCLPKLRAQTRQCASRSTACMTCHQGTERNSREITIWGLRKTMSKPFLWVNTWGRLYSFFPLHPILCDAAKTDGAAQAWGYWGHSSTSSNIGIAPAKISYGLTN